MCLRSTSFEWKVMTIENILRPKRGKSEQLIAHRRQRRTAFRRNCIKLKVTAMFVTQCSGAMRRTLRSQTTFSVLSCQRWNQVPLKIMKRIPIQWMIFIENMGLGLFPANRFGYFDFQSKSLIGNRYPDFKLKSPKSKSIQNQTSKSPRTVSDVVDVIVELYPLALWWKRRNRIEMRWTLSSIRNSSGGTIPCHLPRTSREIEYRKRTQPEWENVAQNNFWLLEIYVWGSCGCVCVLCALPFASLAAVTSQK